MEVRRRELLDLFLTSLCCSGYQRFKKPAGLYPTML
jgi:hypothetical protein